MITCAGPEAAASCQTSSSVEQDKTKPKMPPNLPDAVFGHYLKTGLHTVLVMAAQMHTQTPCGHNLADLNVSDHRPAAIGRPWQPTLKARNFWTQWAAAAAGK